MESKNSPSQHINKLYDEFEKRRMDIAPISQAIQRVTGTIDRSNLEVVTNWIDEMPDSKTNNPF